MIYQTYKTYRLMLCGTETELQQLLEIGLNEIMFARKVFKESNFDKENLNSTKYLKARNENTRIQDTLNTVRKELEVTLFKFLFVF